MAYLIKADELLGFEHYARQCGLDPEQELAQVGLSVDKLMAPEAFIRFVQLSRLLEQAATHSGNPLFGAALARASGTQTLEGPVTTMLRHAPTLGDALDYGLRHNYAYGPSVLFAARPADGGLATDLCLESRSRDGQHAQALEFILGRMVLFAEWLIDGAFSPVCVSLCGRERALQRGYEAIFRCPVVVDAPVTSLRLTNAALQRPLPHANAMLFRMCLSYVEANFGRQAGPIGDRARLLIRQWLDAGPVTLDQVAKGLALHPKALQRQLESEGVHFEQILDEVRKARFTELARSGDRLPLLQMAQALGYAEQTALTRACKRWFGLTPRDYLKQLP